MKKYSALLVLLIGCSGESFTSTKPAGVDESDSGDAGAQATSTGGAQPGTGGKTGGTGGQRNTGGETTSTGGAEPDAGEVDTGAGGASTGGSSQGTGGSSQNTGGSSQETGGSSQTGGAPTTGGVANTGGTSTGGASTGGMPTGGTPGTGGALPCGGSGYVVHHTGVDGLTWTDCTPTGTYDVVQATQACKTWCEANGCSNCNTFFCSGVAYVFGGSTTNVKGWALSSGEVVSGAGPCVHAGTWD